MMIDRFNQSGNQSSNELDCCCSLVGWLIHNTNSISRLINRDKDIALSLSLCLSISVELLLLWERVSECLRLMMLVFGDEFVVVVVLEEQRSY